LNGRGLYTKNNIGVRIENSDFNECSDIIKQEYGYIKFNNCNYTIYVHILNKKIKQLYNILYIYILVILISLKI